MRNQKWAELSLLLLTLVAMGAQAQTCKSEIPASTPDSQLQDNGDGTVTDLKTGLMWKQCTEGQSGSGCVDGSPIDYNIWQKALQRAQDVNNSGGFAGFSDWRVPNIKELASLVELQCREPAINLTRFPNTPASSYFWSSSIYAGQGDYSWTVSRFGDFDGFSNDVDIPQLTKPKLRLVRSAP